MKGRGSERPQAEPGTTFAFSNEANYLRRNYNNNTFNYEATYNNRFLKSF